MTKVTNIKNRMYNLPEDIAFLLNDLDEKDQEIADLKAEIRELRAELKMEMNQRNAGYPGYD